MKHPVLAGWIAGSLEISVTFPFEYVKTQLQLQQQASGMTRATAESKLYRGSIDCVVRTVKQHGLAGLYRGGMSWVVFAGPRSAVRFGVFEALSAASREHGLPALYGAAAVDTTNGFFAGLFEAALCQTPNQVIAIKMIHDQAPGGPHQYRIWQPMAGVRTAFPHTVASIWRAERLLGFFQGVGPATLKGAVTNAIRFLGYGAIKRVLQGEPAADGAPAAPLAPWQSMLAGGTAGAVSAVVSQPIDTVKANMMGLEARQLFRSSWHCAASLVRAGGVLTLFNGVGPRVVRVFIEVGLQFTLFESVGRMLDRHLSPPSSHTHRSPSTS
jgi:solute carrier family 25 citrate transporter 1